MLSFLAHSGGGGYLDPDAVLLYEEPTAVLTAHPMLDMAQLLTPHRSGALLLRSAPHHGHGHDATAPHGTAPLGPPTDPVTPPRQSTLGDTLDDTLGDTLDDTLGDTQDAASQPPGTQPAAAASPAADRRRRRRPRPSDGGGGGDVPRGLPLDVPLWAAVALHMCGAVALRPPDAWSQEALLAFKMDAALPSLAARGPYVMETGAIVSTYLPALEGARVADAILGVFLRRYYYVYTAALAKGHDVAAAREKLSLREQRVMRGILGDNAARERWRHRGALGALDQ